MPYNQAKMMKKYVIRSYYKDGLWDIFMSLLMLPFIAGPLLHGVGLGDFLSSTVFLPVFGAAWVLVRQLKIRIILPRLSARLIENEQTKRLRGWVHWLHFMILAGLFAGIFMVWFWERQPKSWLFSAFLSGAFLVGFYVGAAMLNFIRLYYYGLFTGCAIIAGEILCQNYDIPHHGFPLMFGIISFIMLLTGFYLLFRFLKNHPRVP